MLSKRLKPNFSKKHFSTSSSLRGKALVIAEHDNKKLAGGTLNTITAASKFGHFDVLVIGNNCDAIAETISTLKGVKTVFINNDLNFEHPTAECLTEAVLDHQKKENYTHLVAPSSAFGKNFLPRLGAFLDVQPISDVQKVIDDDTFVRPIYAGSALETIKSTDKVKLITIRTTSFEAATKSTEKAPIQKISRVQLSDNSNKSKWVKNVVQTSDRPDLTSADVIVTGGRGVKVAENFSYIYDLAKPLKAGVGATRAVVDAGFVPNDMQIGQTGKIVAPTLYIAAGVSGAIQHIAGMKGSKVIVAINNDPDAPIFSVSDYGLVADIFTALPELTQKISMLKE